QMERDVAMAAGAVVSAVPAVVPAPRVGGGAGYPAAPLPGGPRTVLVTGPTGFVGSRLVHDLLAGTGLRVRCLARAATDDEAAERVAASLAERGLWQPGFAARLEGYAG